MNREVNIEDLAKMWSCRLRACQYAGELVVGEAELPALAGTIRRDLFSDRRSQYTCTCLFVLAINCMYYYHDEQGFWTHFCELLDVSDSASSQSWLGEMFESQLLEYGFLPSAGYGPFRYVTPMREQCGITRTELPRFARLLSWMTECYGWDGIRLLEPAQLADIAFHHIPTGHLSRFLRTEQGCFFVRDVARNMSQFQRSIISIEDLNDLAGYRAGFFAELFDALGSMPDLVAESVSRPPPPRLLFLPEFRQVGLCFDMLSLNKGRYKISSEIVRRTPLLWQIPDDYRAKITGSRRDTNGEWSNWSIGGWDPDTSAIALFHVDRGFLDYRTGVSPGEYFMLGPYESPPPDRFRQSDYGMVDLPFHDLEIDAWRIVVSDSTDVEFLGITAPSDNPPSDLIAWSKQGNPVPGTLESDMVFVGSLPALSIRQPELFSSNSVALFVDDGGGGRRIRIDAQQNTVELPVRPPAQGCVWVEPISRLREFAGLDVLDELPFYVLPEFNICWPRGLYALGEELEVTISSPNESISLELDNGLPLDDLHCHWRIDSAATVIQGRIRAPKFEVPVVRRIYRATLRKQHQQLASYMLGEDINTDALWVLAGFPHEPAVLALFDGSGTEPLGTLGRFNDAGECRFPSIAIRDTITRCRSPVGRLVVKHGDEYLNLPTIFVHSPELCDWVANFADCSAPPWWPLLNQPMKNFLSATTAIRDAAARELVLPAGAAELPVHLQSFCRTVVACAAVLDDTVVKDRPTQSREDLIREHQAFDPQEAAFLGWYLKADSFVHAGDAAGDTNAEALIHAFDQIRWLPPFTRWQEATQQTLAHLKADDEAVPLLREWKEDVEGGLRKTYTSRIAKQHGGRELTRAWIQYSRYANYDAAVQAAKPLTLRTASPVSDLAAMLLVVCWLRCALFDSQPAIECKSTNKKLADTYRELKQLAFLGGPSVITERPALEALSRLIPALPLPPEDFEFLTAVRDRDGFSNSSAELDWLTCYYAVRFAEAGISGDVIALAARLRSLAEFVPASPDSRHITDAMERNSDS